MGGGESDRSTLEVIPCRLTRPHLDGYQLLTFRRVPMYSVRDGPYGREAVGRGPRVTRVSYVRGGMVGYLVTKVPVLFDISTAVESLCRPSPTAFGTHVVARSRSGPTSCGSGTWRTCCCPRPSTSRRLTPGAPGRPTGARASHLTMSASPPRKRHVSKKISKKPAASPRAAAGEISPGFRRTHTRRYVSRSASRRATTREQP